MSAPELERYTIIGELGQGGMSVVYRARDVQLSRDVAVKVLHGFLAKQPEARRRFHREAVAVAKLHHPGILEIFDYSGPDADQAYIVTELIEGRTLRKFVEDKGTPRFPELALLVLAELTRALRHAHEQGVVHRDLKPENIFLTEHADGGDFIKLLDFGIAKLLCAGSSPRLTRAGTAVGTPNYISPEQALGADVDHRADIYSFGIILYELATGRRPFASADVVETVAKQVTEVPARPRDLDGSRDIPPALDDLIMQCIAKRAADRPQCMESVEARLRAIGALLGGTSEVWLPSAPEPSLAAVSFSSVQLPVVLPVAPRRLALGAAALIAIGLGGFGLARSIEDGQPVAHAAPESAAEPPLPAPAPVPPPARDVAIPRRLHGPPLAAAPRRSQRRSTPRADAPAAPVHVAPAALAPASAPPAAPPPPPGRYDIIPVY